MTKKQTAEESVRRLKEAYPDAICSLESTQPHELLIATRLSAQCTDARVNIVTKVLFDRYRTIHDFAVADLADVESIPADIRQALINNGGGHLNHALFWN